MSAPTNHWRLGLFVVVGIVAALGTAVYLGAESLRRQHVAYETYFDESVQGLDVGAPVKFRGVTVGEVTEIDIAPDRRLVEVTSGLSTSDLRGLGLGEGNGGNTRVFIPHDLRVQIASEGITGVKFLQLDFFDVESNPAPVLPFPTPDRYLPAARSTIKNLQASVIHAVDRFPEVADAILAVAAHAERVLADVEREQLPQGMARTLAGADRLIARLEGAIDDAAVGKVSAQAQASLASLDAVAVRASAALARIDGERGLIASAQRATDAIGDVATSSPELGDELVETLRGVRETMASLRRLSEALEQDPDMLLKGRGGGQ
jgi:phospholipid/cholesterol/gamma-HCH transport system substrate-binding protein